MNLGPTELIVILVIALIVFGPRKLPDLGKTLGSAMAQFRRASDDFKRSWEQEVETEKTRLSEIKSDIDGIGQSIDSAGSDFNYSMDPNRGEADIASSENSELTSEQSIGDTGEVEHVAGTEPTGADEPGSQSDAATPEPATVARTGDSSRTEPWI